MLFTWKFYNIICCMWVACTPVSIWSRRATCGNPSSPFLLRFVGLEVRSTEWAASILPTKNLTDLMLYSWGWYMYYWAVLQLFLFYRLNLQACHILIIAINGVHFDICTHYALLMSTHPLDWDSSLFSLSPSVRSFPAPKSLLISVSNPTYLSPITVFLPSLLLPSMKENM